MEINVLDYILTEILLIVNEENKVHLVVFYSCTIVKLNYDMHDKKILAIFETFKIW